MNYRITGFGIEIMNKDIAKCNFEDAQQMCEEIGERWRLPKGEECFAIFSVKEFGCGNFHDSFYWVSDPVSDLVLTNDSRMRSIFRPDRFFVATRSKNDLYYVRLVRDI
jgi:hypothetical protein